jgi:hypothetical protein
MTIISVVWCTGLLFWQTCENVTVAKVCVDVTTYEHKEAIVRKSCTELEMKEGKYTGRYRQYIE